MNFFHDAFFLVTMNRSHEFYLINPCDWNSFNWTNKLKSTSSGPFLFILMLCIVLICLYSGDFSHVTLPRYGLFYDVFRSLVFRHVCSFMFFICFFKPLITVILLNYQILGHADVHATDPTGQHTGGGGVANVEPFLGHI